MTRTPAAAAHRTQDILGRWAAALSVAVFPLASAWWAADPTTALRAIVLAAVLAVGLIATKGALSLPLAVWWTSTAFLAVFTLSALLSHTPVMSLLGRFPRYEGLPWLLACLVAAGLAGRLASHPDLVSRTVPGALLTASLITGASALLDTLSEPDMRIATVLGNASDAAALAVVCLAASLVLSGGWMRWATVATACLIIVLAASRGALIAALGVLLAAGVWAMLRKRSLRSATPCVVAALLAAASLLAPSTRSRILGDSPLATATVTGRLTMWRETLDLWLTRPLTGVGPSRFVDDINLVPTHAPAAGTLPSDSPHNLILQLLASTGILGAAAATAVAGTILIAWWPRRHEPAVQAAALASLGTLTVLMTHVSSPSFLLPVVFLVGLSLGHPSNPDPARLPVRIVGFLLAGSLLTGGGWMLVTESMLGAAVLKASRLDPRAEAAVLEATRLTADPDFHRRAGYVLTGLAGRGAADAQHAVELLERTCPRLPNSTECSETFERARGLTRR